jgi:DnaJ-class molecular chaperone
MSMGLRLVPVDWIPCKRCFGHGVTHYGDGSVGVCKTCEGGGRVDGNLKRFGGEYDGVRDEGPL